MLIRKRQVGSHHATTPLAKLREPQRHEYHPTHYGYHEHHKYQILNCHRCKNNEEDPKNYHEPTKGSPLDVGFPVHLENIDIRNNERREYSCR